MFGYGFMGVVIFLELFLLFISCFMFGILYILLINIVEEKYFVVLRLVGKYVLDVEEVYNVCWVIFSFLCEIIEGNYVVVLRLVDKYVLDIDEVYKICWVLFDYGWEVI